ncbi:MAG: hypothetical protein OEY23_13265, partial [Acidimicrobiia bacterium]|nr:hypothetical protein [Acidimicrobiia bacterium]
LYWAVAARMYSAGDLGRGTALVAAMSYLSVISQLGLPNALTRLVPLAPAGRRGRLIGKASLASGLTGLALGAAVVAFGHDSDLLGRSPVHTGVLLSLGVGVWSIFTVQDGALVGLREARLVPVENVMFGVGKLVLLVALARVAPSLGILASWLLAAGAAASVVARLVYRKAAQATPEAEAWSAPAAVDTAETSNRESQVGFIAGHYVAGLLSLSVVYVPPVMLFALLGAEQTAYFAVVWTVGLTLAIAAEAFMMPVTVELASTEDSPASPHARSAARHSFGAFALGSVALAAAAPVALALLGTGVADRAAPLLRLVALGVVPRLVTVVYLATARARGQVKQMLAVEGFTALAVLGGGQLLFERTGASAFGWAYLTANVVTALAVLSSVSGLVLDRRAGFAGSVSSGLNRLAGAVALRPEDEASPAVHTLRLISASAGLIALVLLFTGPAAGPLRLACVLTFLLGAPGLAVLRRARITDPLAEVALAAATSMAVVGAVSAFMGLTGFWRPRAAFVALVVVVAVPLVPEIAASVRQASYRALVPAARRPGAWALLSTVSLVLWAWSLLGTDLDAISDLGLLPALPLSWYAALGLAVAGAVGELTRPAIREWRLAASAAVLIAVIHATTAVLYDAPRYSWSYKHLGVVAYIQANHHIDPSIDVYQAWPSMFSTTALATTVAGVGTRTFYANWAPVMWNAAYVLAVLFAARAAGADRRRSWAAVFVFLSANWIGQDYFAPQAAAFFVHLVIVGGALFWWPDRPADGARVPAWVAPVLLGAFTFVASGHPLTPLMTCVALWSLRVRGRLRSWLLPIGATVLCVAWLGIVARPVVLDLGNAALASFGTLGANLDENLSDLSTQTAAARIVASTARGLSVTVGLLAALGAIVERRRSGRWNVTVALLAMAHVPLVVAQSYGGEMVFRIYLFSLPWLAILAAGALSALPAVRSHWAKAAAVGAAHTLLVGALSVAYLGNEETHHLSSAESALAYSMHRSAPDGALLAALAPDWPLKLSADYDSFDYLALLDSGSGFELTDRTSVRADDVERLTSVLRGWQRPVFLLVSQSQLAGLVARGQLTADAATELVDEIAASPSLLPLFTSDRGTVYRLE